jgi:ADP-ribose pyrophosphatase YjhB (NUDIX family)
MLWQSRSSPSKFILRGKVCYPTPMPIEKWKKLSEKTIFEHPRLTLIEDTVLLSNGQETKYLRYKRTGHVATIIAIRDDGLILLQREYSHPPNEILTEFPGGSVPNEEDIAEGANRELMEECGLRGDVELIGSYYADNRRTDSKTHVFVAQICKKQAFPLTPKNFWSTIGIVKKLSMPW